ncbi:MAG: DNA/RNA non-specific endonuclease [Hydrogenophaga sp.]|nr:DNA/RNA non-specific endonuclease [Hydrogenophaga sp.]
MWAMLPTTLPCGSAASYQPKGNKGLTMKTSSFLKAAAITASLVASGLFSAGSATAQTTPSWINNSPLIHSYVHGGLVNNNQANNAVGATGVLRGQLSWQTPADLDIRLLLPDGIGPYVGSNFESFLLKNPLFTDTPDRHVWAGQKTVDFSNGQAKAALDVDVRDGVANGPNGQRIENIYLSGNIPTGTYQFAVENYDNSHYHRNNPDAPATQFNLSVTLSGAGYIIPSDNMPFEVATGYAYGATGALKEHAAVSPIYEVNYFNPGLDTLHAPGIDLFKRFNSNFLPAAYLTALSVPGINPARVPSFIDELRPQKTHLDSTENLANMGRNRLEADFQKLLESGDKNATMAYRLRNGDIINAGKSDFLKAFLAIDASNAKKREADAFLAGLPEQTLREFQDIQKQHGVLNNIRELRSGDRIAVLPSQVTNAITQNQGEWHKNDAQIAHQIFNDMVAGRTTTNAAKLFANKQAIAYDGSPMDVAYVRNSHGDVLAMSRQMIAEQASNAEYTKYLNALRAAEQRRLEAERQKANQYVGLVCTNAAANASVACDAPGAVFMSPSLQTAKSVSSELPFTKNPRIIDPNYTGAMSGYGTLSDGSQAFIANPYYVPPPVVASSGLSGYQKISLGIHTTLGTAGAFPVLGAIPDGIDVLYTAAEIPFGQSTYIDLGLASGGFASSVVPGLDQGLAFGRVSSRTLRVIGELGDEVVDAPKVDNVVYAPQGSKGNWDSAINAGKGGTYSPNTAFVLDNGHTYRTDSLGRVEEVAGNLSNNKAARNSYQQICAGSKGCSGDDGGHLIASALGGAGDGINLVPQSATLNRQDWKDMENYLRGELQAGKNVSVKIDVRYPAEGGVRPNKFEVSITVDGESIVKEFKQ